MGRDRGGVFPLMTREAGRSHAVAALRWLFGREDEGGVEDG